MHKGGMSAHDLLQVCFPPSLSIYRSASDTQRQGSAHSLPKCFRVASVGVDVLDDAQDVREDVLVELLHRTQPGVDDVIDCRIARRHPAL